ncbi:MAG TPA: divergent polysaccharide deacetylase family protein [Gammaproteobacteria bacterium]|nr:divergent polysaccharide deacetylase family protein [Gammaproteobacteria bacterium]
MRALLVLALLAVPLGTVADSQARPPVIAVVIDDMGNSLQEGKRVVALPGPVACSILPHTIDGPELADLAHAASKEVLLHLPMESIEDKPLGTGGITLEMTEREIRATVADDLASLPHLSGMNNHEGSLITQHPGDMAWILQTLRAAGNYYYIDSYTTADSVAYQIAREQQVPAARRNVFLDDVNTEAAVREQWERLLKLARRDGFALAIGHPRPATLSVLEQELPQLAAANVMLVAPSKIVEMQEKHPLPDVATFPSVPSAVTTR